MTTTFDISALASAYGQLALLNVLQEYPNKLDHVMNEAGDARSPRDLHPAFYGSFDWHSSVHMHWLLARLLRVAPGKVDKPAIAALFDTHFSPQAIGGELAYLQQPCRSSFERTYGWAWLLKLQTELIVLSCNDARAGNWSSALQPLADRFVELYLDYLPRAAFPIRSGTHANSAWGLLFALDYAETCGHEALSFMIQDRARKWYSNDRNYPAAYEPGGEDFLSAGLLEAVVMQRVLKAGFATWWQDFCPAENELAAWLSPIAIIDRDDPRLCHLDGLNLSRAWCWKRLAGDLPAMLQNKAHASIKNHLRVTLPHAGTGNYVGTHWLASFATLALTEPVLAQ